MSEIYLGALSGTSMDAVDVAAANFEDRKITPLAFISHPIDSGLAQAARRLQNEAQPLAASAQLDCEFAHLFADAVNALLQQHKLPAGEIKALGLHGQTVLHDPGARCPFSVQIGNPNIVAAKTGLTTVADFRRGDIAHGGQGAPLTPAFHAVAFGRPGCEKAVINIGGIANITFLSKQGAVTAGFDTGPGNCLMDAWTRHHQQTDFDAGGQWAASAHPDPALLEKLSADPYFQAPPPKSACTSQFDLAWLKRRLSSRCDPAVVQATLAELSVKHIARAIRDHAPAIQKALVCGGGVHNRHLMEKLQQQIEAPVATTLEENIDPLQVEALAFAWLARCRLKMEKCRVQAATGAREPAVLGAVYQPAK